MTGRSTGAAWAALLALVVLAWNPPGGRAQVQPTFSVSDASANEGGFAEFTVSLANANGVESSVGFTTNDGTALGSNDTRPFPSSGSIALGDGPSTPYGVTINVTGLTGPVTSVSMFINGLTHPNPDHLDVMLESPDGRTMILQSDVGGAAPATGVPYFLRDYNPLVTGRLIASTYGATNVGSGDTFPLPAPQGSPAEPPPAGAATLNDVFLGAVGIGAWRTWIVDDTIGGVGTLDGLVLAVGQQEPGTDFDHTFGRIVFPPGTTSVRVRVPIFTDSAAEPGETFVVDLGVPVNGTIGDGQGVGTILDGGGGARPTARDDSYTTYAYAHRTFVVPAASGVLVNDSSNGGGRMSAFLADGPRYGTVQISDDGAFVYTRNPGFTGTDSFTYRAVNGFGSSEIATVSVTVTPLTEPPPPRNVRVTNIRSNAAGAPHTVQVRFDKPTGLLPDARFELAGGYGPGQELAVVDTGIDPAYTFSVHPGSYSFRMRTVVGAVRSANSNEVPLHANTLVTPSAPANLLSVVDGSRVTLAWTNTFGGGIPINVVLDVSGDAVATLPLGAVDAVTFPQVPPGQYDVRVRALNSGGASPPSNPVTLTVPSVCTGVPDPPSDFLLYRPGGLVQALWELPLQGQAPTDYVVNVVSQVFTGGIPVAGRTLGGQVPPGSYTLSVAARNSCGTSAPTAAQTVVVP